MNSSVAGLRCIACETSLDADTAASLVGTQHCPDCGGLLDFEYEYATTELGRELLSDSSEDSIYRYADLLPVEPEDAVTLGEGQTPLHDCPTLGEELGVGSVRLKDESSNPTGSHTARGVSLAISASVEEGDVAIAAPGTGAEACAAYAARTALDAHLFVPSRSGFISKAMVNVYGGEMSVIEGRYDDAEAALEAELEEQADWQSLQPFVSPLRHEGEKTIGFELVEQLDWSVPDAIVVPVGSGTTLVGIWKAIRELQTFGLIDETPRIYAAQPDGCAPFVEAFESTIEGGEPGDPVWETPDTIVGELEIPDPRGRSRVVQALEASGGTGVTSSDDDALDSALLLAQHEGVAVGAAGGVAASAAWTLSQDGMFEADDTVVILNPGGASNAPDVLRSHLMGAGI